MTRRRIHQSIAILMLAVGLAVPSTVGAREPGAFAVVAGSAPSDPAASAEGEDLTPLRGHEQVPILLARRTTRSGPSLVPTVSEARANGAGPTGGGRWYLPVAAAIAATCWVCAIISIPRKPRVGNEVAELVYSRLLGRQDRLVLLAGTATAALLLALTLSLP